jgi:hypothetical protein
MPRIDEIVHTMNKLNKAETDFEGKIVYKDDRGNENRYAYYYKKTLVFSFGMTRGYKKKENDYWYVPRQMGLTNKQFNELHNCTMSKKQYNEHLKNTEKIKISPDTKKIKEIKKKSKKRHR